METSLWILLIFALIPSAAVPIAVVYLVKQFLQSRQQLELIALQQQNSSKTLPLKLQAYERLTLLFERIHIPTLIAKVKTGRMSSGDLQAALMVSIQQEFEHNVTQQIYVSDKLWELLNLTKNELFHQLQERMVATAFNEDVEYYSRTLIEHFSQPDKDVTRRALYAIHQEARLLM